MHATFIKILAFVFGWLLNGQLLAQQQNTNRPPLSIGFQAGFVATGPSHNLYNYMEKSGFGKAGGFFSIDYPRKAQLAGTLAIRYRLDNLFSVKGSFCLLNSWVVGHDSFRRWRADMDITSPAVLGLIHSRDQLFYVGTGPSVNFIRFRSTKFSSTNTDVFRNKFQKIGWVVESGLQVPANSRLFADVHLRYAYAGKKKEGPFLFQGQSLISDINGANAPDRTVPAYEVPYNNFTINLGGGIRVGKLAAR